MRFSSFYRTNLLVCVIKSSPDNALSSCRRKKKVYRIVLQNNLQKWLAHFVKINAKIIEVKLLLRRFGHAQGNGSHRANLTVTPSISRNEKNRNAVQRFGVPAKISFDCQDRTSIKLSAIKDKVIKSNVTNKL